MMYARANRTATAALACAAVGVALSMPDLAGAQVVYTERPPSAAPPPPALFGVAAQKICEIKTFLFAIVYVFAAIAFVVFSVRALFAKFEMKQFFPIIGAIFLVASADLFIAWIASDAYYCPTTFSRMMG